MGAKNWMSYATGACTTGIIDSDLLNEITIDSDILANMTLPGDIADRDVAASANLDSSSTSSSSTSSSSVPMMIGAAWMMTVLLGGAITGILVLRKKRAPMRTDDRYGTFNTPLKGENEGLGI